jgi:hypothetical protein
MASPALVVMDLVDLSLHELCRLFLPQRPPHSASLITWKAFACTILPTIRLLSLMIRLIRLVVALESLLNWIMNNRGEPVDENVIIFDFFARRKRKLIFAFHFLTIEDPQIEDVCLGPNPRSIFEIARYFVDSRGVKRCLKLRHLPQLRRKVE